MINGEKRRISPSDFDFNPPTSTRTWQVDEDAESSARPDLSWLYAMEASMSFTPIPPYPAGPNLSKIKYPRNVSGPRYQCPECEQQFQFHHLTGIVVCPFCQKTVTVGRYNKQKSTVFFVAGSIFLIISAAVLTAYFIFFPKQPYVLISVLLIAIAGFIALVKGAHTRNRYPDAIRVEQDFTGY